MGEFLRSLVERSMVTLDDVSEVAGDGHQHVTKGLPTLLPLPLVQAVPGLNLTVDRRELQGALMQGPRRARGWIHDVLLKGSRSRQ
jgi:hypothetical protein